MKFWKRLLLLVVSVFSATAAISSTVPVEKFFKRPDFRTGALSPNGKLLGVLAPFSGRINLAVIDLEKRQLLRTTSFENNDVFNFYWVNDHRLVFTVADLEEASGKIRSKGIYAANIDGSDARNLSLERRLLAFLSSLPNAGDDILVESNERDAKSLDVYRLNTRTGRKTLLTFDNPGEVRKWLLDQNQVPRIAISYNDDKGLITTYHRNDADARWTSIESHEENNPHWEPLGFDFDDKTLFVASNIGRDKRAIYTFDPDKKALKGPIFEHSKVDVERVIFDRSKKKAVGFFYDADKPGTKWIDSDWIELQSKVDQALPGRINRLSKGRDNDQSFLIYSYSDTSPGELLLLDAKNLKMEQVADFRSWLNSQEMSERRYIEYKARDGLVIPAYLTIPKSSNGKNLPLVVDIHGGPFVRGETHGFDDLAQFLASRGYAVLQPNFRGTTGMGIKHFQSGWKQWGLAMQDDINDGVDALISEGVVDKNRVCLSGGSYGGYATLVGLAKSPSKFKCGIAYVAVTDLEILQSATWSDTNRAEEKKGTERFYKTQIGDPDKEKDLLRANSPLLLAEKIQAPVMLAFGGDDQRVPLIHGEKFRAALDKAGKKYEWVVYEGEGHGFNKDANRFDFYKRFENFLKANL